MDNPQDLVSQLRSIIGDLWPFVTFFVGAWFTAKQSRDQLTYQNNLQRDQAWRDRQVAAIDALQKAITEASDGVWQASIEYQKEIRALPVRVAEARAAGRLPEPPDFANEPWHQEWRAANRAVTIAASRVDDQDVDAAVVEYVRIANQVLETENIEERNIFLQFKVQRANGGV